MNQEDATQFSRAVNLAQTGNKAAAHATFTTLCAKYPDNTLALLWFAFTSPSIAAAQKAILRATQLEPNNPNVQQAHSWLEAEIAKSESALTPLAPALEVAPTNLGKQPQLFPPNTQQAPQQATFKHAATLEASEPNVDYNTRFNQAVLLAQAGNTTQAYHNLKVLAKETSANDANLLLWIAFTSPDLEEAVNAINLAETQSPANPNISGAKSWLRQERLKANNNSSITTAGFKVGANNFDFKAQTNQGTVGYRPQPQGFETASAQKFQPGLNTSFNSLETGPQLVSVAPTTGTKRGVNSLSILVMALGVVVVLLIGWGIFFFTSSSTSEPNQSVFGKTGLSTYSQLDQLEVPQKLKDQIPTFYSSADLAKIGYKYSQMEVYKIKTTSPADDFTKYYKSEFSKDGWNLQSMPLPNNNNSQTFMMAGKGKYYIFLTVVAASNPLPELKSQLAPNQSVAIVVLFEKI